MTTIGSDDLVSVDEAREAFLVLAPIIDTTGDPDAVEAASRVVARMSEGLLRAVLDWWLVVTTEASTPTGDAFRLPDTVPAEFRGPMEELVAI